MKIALFQQDTLWADPKGNRDKLDAALRSAGKADLYVFPEMFSTGFATVPEGIAEEDPCETLQWMKEKADEYDAAIAGSVALHVDGSYRNRFYFVTPGGGVTFYDKHHLFTYGGEHHRFTGGDERVIVEWRGVRFRLIVCYDLRFPVWIRNEGGYDALICIASWPVPRQGAFDALLRARAIENQCYVLGVNRVGDDPSCKYAGGTALIDPYGETLSKVEYGVEGTASGEIDMQALEEFRKKFPVLSDADKFSINV